MICVAPVKLSKFADIGSMPPKVPAVNIKGRQRQNSIFKAFKIDMY